MISNVIESRTSIGTYLIVTCLSDLFWLRKLLKKVLKNREQNFFHQKNNSGVSNSKRFVTVNCMFKFNPPKANLISSVKQNFMNFLLKFSHQTICCYTLINFNLFNSLDEKKNEILSFNVHKKKPTNISKCHSISSLETLETNIWASNENSKFVIFKLTFRLLLIGGSFFLDQNLIKNLLSRF